MSAIAASYCPGVMIAGHTIDRKSTVGSDQQIFGIVRQPPARFKIEMQLVRLPCIAQRLTHNATQRVHPRVKPVILLGDDHAPAYACHAHILSCSMRILLQSIMTMQEALQ